MRLTYALLMMVVLTFVACNPAKSELDEAIMSFEQNGASIECVRAFAAIVKKYPDKPEAKVAKDYIECHKAILSENHNKPIQWDLYLAIKDSVVCRQRAEKWLAEYETQDKAACMEAQADPSESSWQTYVDKYPSGSCARQAQAFIQEGNRPSNMPCRLESYGRNGKLSSYYNFKFDKDGRLVQGERGKIDKWDTSTEYIYSYDSEGRLEKLTESREDNVVETSTFKYETGPIGLVISRIVQRAKHHTKSSGLMAKMYPSKHKQMRVE